MKRRLAVGGGPERERSASLPRLLLFLFAWLLGAAPLLADDWLAPHLAEGSRAALAWFPWVALIGLPLGDELRRDWPLALGLALPVIAVAIWLDLRAGLLSQRLEATSAAGLLALCTLGEARHQAQLGRLRSYAPLWFATLVLAPALSVAFAWGRTGSATGDGLAGAIASLSPIASLWRDVNPTVGGSVREALNSALFCPSTIVCVLLLVVAWSLRRRVRER